jgi:hypothetical protein
MAKNIHSQLSGEQLALLEKFNQLLSSTTTLTKKQVQYCSDDCLLRYLKARDWDVKKAYTMIMNTLKWRDEFKPDEIQASELTFEASSGKTVRYGFDNTGCPVVYITPARENSTDYEKNMKLLVYTIERAIESMPEGVEQMIWVLHFDGYTAKNAPPLSICRETLNILSNHYPERLKSAILVDTPWIFNLLWKAVTPLIPSATKEKVYFVRGDDEKKKVMSKFFDLSQLEPRFGGSSTFSWISQFNEIWNQQIESDKLSRIGLSC